MLAGGLLVRHAASCIVGASVVTMGDGEFFSEMVIIAEFFSPPIPPSSPLLPLLNLQPTSTAVAIGLSSGWDTCGRSRRAARLRSRGPLQ